MGRGECLEFFVVGRNPGRVSFRGLNYGNFERLDYRMLAVLQLCDVRDRSCVQSCQITVESGTHPHKVSIAPLTFLTCKTTFVVVLVSVILVFKLQTVFIS